MAVELTRKSFTPYVAKKGEEYIRLHAEKDLLELVKHDAHMEVGNDQFRMVAKNLTEEIGENVARTIGKNLTDTVVENVQTTIGKDTSVDIGGKHGVKTGSDASYASGASISVESSAGTDIKVGANLHIKAGANIVIEAGATLTLKVAMISIEGSGPGEHRLNLVGRSGRAMGGRKPSERRTHVLLSASGQRSHVRLLRQSYELISIDHLMGTYALGAKQ